MGRKYCTAGGAKHILGGIYSRNNENTTNESLASQPQGNTASNFIGRWNFSTISTCYERDLSSHCCRCACKSIGASWKVRLPSCLRGRALRSKGRSVQIGNTISDYEPDGMDSSIQAFTRTTVRTSRRQDDHGWRHAPMVQFIDVIDEYDISPQQYHENLYLVNQHAHSSEARDSFLSSLLPSYSGHRGSSDRSARLALRPIRPTRRKGMTMTQPLRLVAEHFVKLPTVRIACQDPQPSKASARTKG